MQTFLPYSSFAASAEVLDTKRLGKQRVEVIQIVRALTVAGYAWKTHPPPASRRSAPRPSCGPPGALPAWLAEDGAVVISHRSALVRKEPEHYRALFPDVPDDLDYVWPVRSPAVIERELRRTQAARQREQRAAERLLAEQARARRRRSLAARRGWVTRAGRAREQTRPSPDLPAGS